MGSPLFERNSHNVSLTEAGDRLLPLAQEALQSANECLTQIKDMADTVTGELNIGVTHSFSTLLTKPLVEFLHTYRQVQLHIYYADSLKLMEMLRTHKIDIALAYKSDRAGNDFESYELFRDRLCAVVRYDHQLASRKSITLAELERDNWGIAMPSQQMQARELLDGYWEQEGEVPHLRKRIELNDANFILDLLDDSNLLVGILSKETMRHRRGLVAIPLEAERQIGGEADGQKGGAFEMQGCVHVLKDAYTKRAVKIFVDLLKKDVKE